MRIDVTLTGKTLAAGAVVLLGVVLAMAGTIARGTDLGPVNAAAVAQTMLDEKDHVTAGELAQWLTEKRTDCQLIDIRLAWQYDDYHIPTAISVPLAELFQPEGLKKLDRSKKIVVYGLGAGHAAEAQLLLSMRSYNALSLKEGISAWWNDVITPMSLRSETQSPAGYQQARELRQHFMGGSEQPARPVTPGAAAPLPPPAQQQAPQAPPASKKLKLGRGCS
jgi:rhodanese-related sulfurtransferase